MAIKFPTSGTRISQGLIFNNLEAPCPKAKPDKPAAPAPQDLEAARPSTHPDTHGWPN
ncbi:MAG TPA: hypothetical protein VGC36_01155 [Rhizomicrobium sp.]